MKLISYILPFLLGKMFLLSDESSLPFSLPIEICDNGIDDDNDGLIDLNDLDDCKCELAIPASLIPNPSFEEYICCPQDRSQLYCAETWIQASEPTTDYLHTCGWMGWPDLPPPTPFPDGNGCIGFRNGRVGNAGGPGPQEDNLNWKEYAGACLISPLRAGTTYRFEFWIGFTQAFNSPATNIAFFGTTDCANLPFGVGNNSFGCPTNGPGWVELGSVHIEGAFQWKLKEITVTPVEDIYAIAIGPNCTEGQLFTNTYYFFDNLVLADAKQFDFKISAAGNPCSNDFSLSLPYADTLSYQWYKNGIALVGETGATLAQVEETNADYQVRVIGPNSCRVTPAYKHKIPFFVTSLDSFVCEDETVFFNNTTLAESGDYVDTLQSYNGCDSIVFLRLQKPSDSKDTVFVKIFEEEKYKFGNATYDKPGEYDAVFTAQNGCDSLVHLFLDFYKVFIPNALSPNGDGINDVFTVYTGTDVKEIKSMEIFDRWGDKVFSRYNLPPNDFDKGWDGNYRGKPGSNGVYTWLVTLLLTDGRQHTIAGSVTILR
ncbi:MAG: gliding motility-associated C-terminal domain-containing protein [Saprospiraceae bacterium]|nr:gliding motility-associated C-terminal domain-containing protein [Saprospiraceae bacterium]